MHYVHHSDMISHCFIVYSIWHTAAGLSSNQYYFIDQIICTVSRMVYIFYNMYAPIKNIPRFPITFYLPITIIHIAFFAH